jgi:tetratricopeptide (TPR) repeat protein
MEEKEINQNHNHNQRKLFQFKGNEYQQAKHQLDLGNLESSLELINLAIEKQERPIYYFLRGNINEKLSKFEECYKDYKKAKELNNTDYTYYENLGRICKELGRNEEAIELFKEIIESETINDDETALALYHYEIGSIYDKLNNHKEAYDYYINAIDLDNKNAINYQYKGDYLHQCNEFKSKLYQLLETSYFYDVNSSKIFAENDNDRPSLALDENKKILDEKISKLRREIENKPYDKSLWEKLAKNLKEAKIFDEAIFYFEKCYDKQKNNKLYLINLADSYLKIKNFHKAIIFANKLESLDSNYFKTYKIKSIAYYELNEMEKALENIEKAIKIQPDNYFSIEFKKKIKYNLDTKSM